MAEILLGQSYYLRFDPKLWQAMQPYPPLGCMYAASYLRSQGFDVGLFDAMLAQSEAEWDQALEREQPRFAILYEDNFNYLSKMCLLRMREAAYQMLESARERGCTVIAAGSDATDHAAGYLAHGAQYVIHGEGEVTLRELLESLTGRGEIPFAEIRGISYIGKDQQICSTPRRPDIHDLDSLPFPAWDLVDVDLYRQIWLKHHGYFSVNVATTRGCPYHCNWCAKPIWGQRYNVRSPENVTAELVWLKQFVQPDHIWFVDDILGLQPGWFERFADLVEQQNVRLPYKCLQRADLLLRGSSIQSLKNSGAQIVWIGAESGSQKVLNAMEKGTRVEQIYEASRQLHAAGMQVGFFLQFGYPGERLEDVERTIQMVRDCHPDDIGISVSYPLPGTKFYRVVAEQMGTKQNWQDSQDMDMLYGGPFQTVFYRQLHRVVHREFRMRRTWDKLHLSPLCALRSLGSLRSVAAMVYAWASLPVERWRLKRLAQDSINPLGSLPAGLSQEEAARTRPGRLDDASMRVQSRIAGEHG